MQGTELFLSLAEIAGVFVGFGALIAVRSGATMEGSEINNIRWVVTIAIWVVIAALAPILISSYGVTGHGPWFVCSLLALVLFVILTVVYGRAPENRADVAATLATMPLAKMALLAGFVIWLPTAILVLALALVVLGLFPNQEQALYLTAVGFGLFMGAMTLLGVVFSPGGSLTASEPARLPAPGGSSAH